MGKVTSLNFDFDVSLGLVARHSNISSGCSFRSDASMVFRCMEEPMKLVVP